MFLLFVIAVILWRIYIGIGVVDFDGVSVLCVIPDHLVTHLDPHIHPCHHM